MTLLTTFEIFGNPKDLFIKVCKSKLTEKYFFYISRGLGHNFKTLISSQPIFDSAEDGVENIRSLLVSIVNNCGEGVDCLNMEMIDSIIVKLKTDGSVETSALFSEVVVSR